LPTTIFPYWLRISRDDVAGGYRLRDDIMRSPVRAAARSLRHGRRPSPPEEKELVSQARLVWVFAHGHRREHDDGTALLDASHRGRQFLLDHHLDHERGGYRWSTDRVGQPRNDVKVLYAQSFVIYAFVELSRASGSREPLDDALELFRVIERELRDEHNGGWREHAHGDWSPLRADDARPGMAFPGRKSANALVHWMEALTALYEEVPDPAVRRALVEAVELCHDPVFPADPGATHEVFLPDWSPDRGGEQRASYGHNVEQAWLLLHARDALGEARDWERLHTYVEHALRVGFDHRRGGAFTWGHGDEAAVGREKIWWVQCELMIALTEALLDRADERYERALAQTVTFVEQSMTDRRDGILLESVHEDGRRRYARKSGNWKAGYHDVRAATRIAEAFAP